MKKILLALIILAAAAAPLLARDLRIREDFGGYTPPPVLLSPTREEVDLTGRDTLEFKWSAHEGLSGIREYYDFRLYKGYDMIESALLIKERLPGDAYQFNVNADKFEDGQTYTWSLRQAYDRDRKSTRNFASFTVIKRQAASPHNQP